MPTILNLLRRAKSATARAPRAATNDAPPDERPCGCGWFDSSHELQAGLLVTEHRSADALGGALPLDDWLELQLCGWHGPLACVAVV